MAQIGNCRGDMPLRRRVANHTVASDKIVHVLLSYLAAHHRQRSECAIVRARHISTARRNSDFRIVQFNRITVNVRKLHAQLFEWRLSKRFSHALRRRARANRMKCDRVESETRFTSSRQTEKNRKARQDI